MTVWKINKSEPLQGELRPPSSKSQTLRAFLFASLSLEGGVIGFPLESEDARAMIDACEKLGARFTPFENSCRVQPIPSSADLSQTLSFNALNSGIVWRFLAGILSTQSSLNLIWGDDSILNRRPMWPLKEALEQVGVSIWQTEGNKGPTLVKGPWKSCLPVIEMDGFDSQPVSSVLIAAAIQEGVELRLKVKNPKEVEWAHLTVYWLRSLGSLIEADEKGENYILLAKPRWKRLDYTVPVDYSSAAFLIAAALVSRGNILLKGLQDDPQPDKSLIPFLLKAGADLEWQVDGSLKVNGQREFNGMNLDISGPIDLLPVLMVLSCYAQTSSVIRGISGARLKESDRVSAMTSELRKMGAKIALSEDELRIEPAVLTSCAGLQSHHDHRIAMALAVAALGTSGESILYETQCAAKTYPDFVQDLLTLGANIINVV